MTAPLAFFWGDDVLELRRAVERFARGLAPEGAPLETWRPDPSDPGALDELAMRLGTAPLFGGGVCAVVADPAAVLRTKAEQDRLLALVAGVAPGNALVFTEQVAGGAREPAAASGRLREAVTQAGGVVQRLEAPRAGQLGPWIAARAAELGMRIEPAAVALLAERIGGSVREGDVDRSRQTEQAEASLHLLALYRPGGPVRRADVDALVSPSVPTSTWAFLDAVGGRKVRQATTLAEALLASGSPLPVLVTQLHRRLRQLLEIRERIADGASPADLVRTLHLNPYRAEILARQAMAWEPTDLEAAVRGLLAVDLASKGLSEDGRRGAGAMTGPLALGLWLAECVAAR